MSEQFDRIKRLYCESYRIHGDSPASLLTPKGRNELRFRAIDPFVVTAEKRILDYGCGLGYLCDYLDSTASNVEYVGIDIVPEFVATCRLKYPHATFLQIEADENIDGLFDIVFSSGVFNLRTHERSEDSKNYAFDRIEKLFGLASEVLICDFPCGFVDFQQPEAQHFGVGEIAEFCVGRLGRRFQIRHDILPYEMTLIVWKDCAIKRPENIYRIDL